MAFDPSGCAAPAFTPQVREVSVTDEIDEARELRSALSGDEAAFTALYRRHQAADLNVVVFTRHADPRSGERIYRLENIKREEPNAELFKVPADYALKAAPTPRDTDRK